MIPDTTKTVNTTPPRRPPPPQLTTTWVGWCWINRQWVRVCASATFADCCRALAREAGKLYVPKHHQLITGGDVPEFPPMPGKR
jgi:hypothetical protein